jgi:hypothetical protein
MKGDYLKDSGVHGRIILKWILEKWDGSMDWIDLTRYRDRLRAFVNAVINLRTPHNAGNFPTS